MTGFSLPSPTRCLHSQYNLLRKAPKMLGGDREIKTPADFPKLTLRLSQWDQETTSGNPIPATRECRWFPTLPTGLMYVYPKQSQTQLNFELKVSTLLAVPAHLTVSFSQSLPLGLPLFLICSKALYLNLSKKKSTSISICFQVSSFLSTQWRTS